MKMPIIRGLAATYDQPTMWSGERDKLVFRRGCFDSVNLSSRLTKALIDHNSNQEFGRGGDELKMWLDDFGLQFEIRPVDNDVGRLAVAGIRNGHYQGSSLGAVHSGSRSITVGGERVLEVTNVRWIEDVSVCQRGACTFTGCTLVDVSQAPRAAGPFRREVTPAPERARGQTARDAQNWHREIVASAKLGMQKKMEQLAAEKLRFSPGSVRGIY